MADITEGLFGPTPEQVRAAQMQTYQQQAQQYGQMSPFDRANAGMFSSGARLGDLIARAAGGVNIAQDQATQQQQAMQGSDLQTPEGLREAAKKMLAIGNQKSAYLLGQKASDLEKEKADIELKQAQAKKALAYQPAGYGNTKEYQDQVDIITDPDSTPEQIKYAQERITALNAKGQRGVMGAGTVKRLSTNIGEIIFDPASKKYTYADGTDVEPEKLRTMVPLGNDPTNAAAVAMAKGGGKTKAEAMAKAQDALPEANNTYSQAVDLLGQIEKDPAFSSLIGFSWKPGAKYIPGSKEAGLDAKLQQLSALAEMHQREKLKGTGQITDYESNMARGAILRATTAQNEEDYRNAMADFKHWMGKSMEALHQRAETPFKMPSTPAIQPPASAQPTPVAAPQPAASASNRPSFSLTLNTPQAVKDAYKSGKIDKYQANSILDDMKQRGLF